MGEIKRTPGISTDVYVNFVSKMVSDPKVSDEQFRKNCKETIELVNKTNYYVDGQ